MTNEPIKVEVHSGGRHISLTYPTADDATSALAVSQTLLAWLEDASSRQPIGFTDRFTAQVELDPTQHADD